MRHPELSVLVVGVKWPPETFLARLFDGLLRQGVHVTVATSARPSEQWFAYPNFGWLHAPTWDVPRGARMVHFGRQVIRAVVTSPLELYRTARSIRSGAGIGKTLRKWNRSLPFVGKLSQFDLIYFPWNGGAISYLSLFEAGLPVVVSCRGSQINVAPQSPAWKPSVDGLRETLVRANAVHCVSDDILNEAVQYGLDRAKARVIRPAVAPDFFTPDPASRPEGAFFNLVSTGSIIWRKGYEYALLATRALLDRGIPLRYRIIGDGPERARVQYTILDLGLQEHVELLGALSPEQVRMHLQQADAFVLSSLSEGISNAVLEAMSCGLPVVTTDCGGMREAVTDGVEGYVVPVRDPGAMAVALSRLYEDEASRRQLGRQARNRIERQFRLEDQVTGFIRLFRDAINAQSRAVHMGGLTQSNREVRPRHEQAKKA